MRKIPTLFVRDPDNRARVTDQVTPGCEWVLAGEGVPTRKYDGTCVMLDAAGRWWARREVKHYKAQPPGFLQVQHDDVTGKIVGWEPIEQSGFVRWHVDALLQAGPDRAWQPGTYELCGPKVNGNPEGYPEHRLIRHADAQVAEHTPRIRPVDLVRDAAALGWEGIVWHHPDGRMAKLKIRDLGGAR